ncbi:hypothetical protein WA556_002331 [Blastocystis sp. ATCC 50177/Nand II]
MCWMDKPLYEFLNRFQTRYCKICRTCRSGQLLRYYEKKKSTTKIKGLKKELAYYSRLTSERMIKEAKQENAQRDHSSSSQPSSDSSPNTSHDSADVILPSDQPCSCIAKPVCIDTHSA